MEAVLAEIVAAPSVDPAMSRVPSSKVVSWSLP